MAKNGEIYFTNSDYYYYLISGTGKKKRNSSVVGFKFDSKGSEIIKFSIPIVKFEEDFKLQTDLEMLYSSIEALKTSLGQIKATLKNTVNFEFKTQSVKAVMLKNADRIQSLTESLNNTSEEDTILRQGLLFQKLKLENANQNLHKKLNSILLKPSNK